MKKVLMILILTMILVFYGFKESSAGTTTGDDFYISIIEGSKVFYGDDVVFNYDFTGGTLVGVNGSIYQTVEDGDFVIDNVNQTVTISSRYLYAVLDRRDDIEMTVFSWVFENEDRTHTVIGYLFINLQEGKEVYTNKSIINDEPLLVSKNIIESNKMGLFDSLKDLFSRITNVFRSRINSNFRNKIRNFIN